MKNCFCLVTHKYDDMIKAQLLRISQDLEGTDTDLYILFDVTTVQSLLGLISLVDDKKMGIFKTTKIYSFKEKDIVSALVSRGYRLEYYERIPVLFYGNIMTAFMKFFLDFNNYDYYWFKEWDVEYTGNWKTLIDKYSSIDDDYISKSVTADAKYNPTWWHAGEWDLTTMEPFKEEELVKTFNPLMRLSNRALRYLDKVYSEGNCGFYEIFLGTALKRAGYKIGGFYERGDLDLAGFKFLQKGRSLDIESLTRKNKLYHPVKIKYNIPR